MGLTGRQQAALYFGRKRRRAVANANHDVSAKTLFARFTNDPGARRKKLISDCIAGLKAAGVWDKLDVLYLTAAHNAQAARLNWKADAFNLSPLNSPVFNSDRGYKGDGVSAYFTTGFNPTFGGPYAFTQDSAHIGVWVSSDDASSSGALGNTNGTILPRNGTSLTARLNSTTGVTTALSPVTAVGHSVVTRPSSTIVDNYKDAVRLGGQTTASLALVSEQMDVLRRRQTSSTYAPWTVLVAHWGSGLSAGEITALRANLLIYLTAIGAVS